ncbi:MAG: DUF4290 domain-containing protein [Bacteroidales bacterium]|jgi:hypothetical protein|nr:DUF4290 domain-containing protein [Bacteroidales bacterium]
MDYNATRTKLALPEYGRNLQNMVDHIRHIEDRAERNRAARTIIDIMANLYPYVRDINDFQHKLWDHLAIMADFQLDIDYPYEPPRRESFNEPPKKVPYEAGPIRLRHYGKITELLIEKAATHDDEQERDALIKMLANHMKKNYLAWNKDSVDDEKIYADIALLSNGRIKCGDLGLTQTKDLLQQRPHKPANNANQPRKAQGNQNGKQQYGAHNGRNNRNNGNGNSNNYKQYRKNS